MRSVLELPELEVFDREDFERAWRDRDAPARTPVQAETAITVSRQSSNDVQDRQIYLWIDEHPLGKIRYGQSIRTPVAPGRHTVRAFNTLFSRRLAVEVAAGEDLRLSCGNGLPSAAGWLVFMFLHVTYLRVWLERE